MASRGGHGGPSSTFEAAQKGKTDERRSQRCEPGGVNGDQTKRTRGRIRGERELELGQGPDDDGLPSNKIWEGSRVIGSPHAYLSRMDVRSNVSSPSVTRARLPRPFHLYLTLPSSPRGPSDSTDSRMDPSCRPRKWPREPKHHDLLGDATESNGAEIAPGPSTCRSP